MLEAIKPFNPILAADGYKGGHWEEEPINIQNRYCVVVPRTVSEYSPLIVAMGQTFIASLFQSIRIQEWMIDEAEVELNEQGYEFNRQGWQIIARMLDGKLPLAIYGVEEGRLVKPQTPIIGVTATQDWFAWLPTYYETFIQEIAWKMSTVATICRSIRVGLLEFCEMTGTDPSAVNYMLHNFGDRGADSPDEAPVMAGISHAAIFDGSDCLRANRYIKTMYGTSKPSTSSIEATEHSIMCAHSDATNKDDWGAALMAVDRLYAAVERAKRGIGIPAVSVVIDTYDSRRFVKDYIGTKLKDKILASGGKIIMRPDSGDPKIEPGLVGKDLEDTFGCTKRLVVDTTYKVLHPAVGVIQGDGIKVGTWRGVVRGWIDAGFAMDGFCLGMGSGVTHDGARDDHSFSMKSVATFKNGRWVPELKDPNTDSGKKSLSGLVRCREDANGELEVYDALQEGTIFSFLDSTPGWRLWYKDGFREFRQSWEEVQRRARS
jgi:nicotinamide phosphoribosyltransferase